MFDANGLAGVAGIVAALTVGVVSPGPSFVMVARLAVAQGRVQALGAALGMGLGGVVFAVAALAGLHAVLLAVPALYMALKVLGGLYLIWLGWRIWRGAKEPLALADSAGVLVAGAEHARSDRPGTASFWRGCATGFATQVSNPKTAIVYASVFAAFLPAVHDMAFNVLVVLAAFAVEAAWYGAVAWGLSASGPRALYLGAKTVLDRLAGGVMVLLGLRLLATARH
jgi:threonine/homoserine/homoserine lactone efflux protein